MRNLKEINLSMYIYILTFNVYVLLPLGVAGDGFSLAEHFYTIINGSEFLLVTRLIKNTFRTPDEECEM